MKKVKKPAPKAAAKKAVAAKKPAVKPAAKAAKSAGKAAKPVAKAAAPKKGAVVAKPAKGAVTKAPAKKAAAPAKPALKAAPGKKGAAPVKAVEKVGKAPMPAKPAKGAAPAKPPKAEGKVAKAEVKVTVSIPEEPDVAEEVVLTDAEGRRYCRIRDCDRLSEVDLYCRYHYILLWNNIQTRRHILQEGKLGRYIEELTARYPDKFLEILKKDLRSEKDFLAAIQELEIDESAVEAEFDDEESQSDLFEVQRMSDTGGGGARSEEDDRF